MPRFPRLDPDAIPLDALFVEDYERTKAMIVKDFAYVGALIVCGVVLGAALNLYVISKLP